MAFIKSGGVRTYGADYSVAELRKLPLQIVYVPIHDGFSATNKQKIVISSIPRLLYVFEAPSKYVDITNSELQVVVHPFFIFVDAIKGKIIKGMPGLD